MKIKRVLNNNTVVSLDGHGDEVILKGKGIAFNKKVGDLIDQPTIEKIFILNTKESKNRYQELYNSVSNDCIELCDSLVDFIKSRLDKDISDNIYVTLTDHVSNLIERIQMGLVFDNGLLWDVKRVYAEEYNIGLEVVERIRDFFHVKIEDDEANFIALHIVNAQLNDNFDYIIKVTSMIEDVYDIVESDFNLEVDPESLVYNRFMIHLRILFERITRSKALINEENETVLETLKQQYPEQFACATKIIDYISIRYNEHYRGEILYLLIHIIKLTNTH